jgi:adenylosuccinate synthase
VLFESAQGTLLDLLHGTYPYVTSSLTAGPAAFPLTGVGIPRDPLVIGIMKAYSTRVGAGPFPTEDAGDVGTWLRDKGSEYGSTTGRPRRCGFLDLPLLRYAVRTCGIGALAILKLDVLSGLAKLPVCVAYDLRGKRHDVPHPDMLADPALKPIYEEWDGWTEDVCGVADPAALPWAAREYVRRIEAGVGVPAILLSTGSDRSHTILVRDPWA